MRAGPPHSGEACRTPGPAWKQLTCWPGHHIEPGLAGPRPVRCPRGSLLSACFSPVCLHAERRVQSPVSPLCPHTRPGPPTASLDERGKELSSGRGNLDFILAAGRAAVPDGCLIRSLPPSLRTLASQRPSRSPHSVSRLCPQPTPSLASFPPKLFPPTTF